jgi:PAS domain S-box-containing protein
MIIGVINLRKIVVISVGEETSRNICKQLKRLIGDKVEVQSYCLDDDISREFKNSLVIVTSKIVEKLAVAILHPNTKYIIARRVMNYHKLRDLISLPAGSEVLLINDHKNSCLITIDQLKKHGINHVKYYPYYPGIKEYKKLELAVTPGEVQLAPSCVKKIIDIDTRQIDITTLVEILNKLDLMEEKGDIISSQFVKDIIDLSKRFNNIAEHSIELKNMLQTILDNSSDGIAYLDLQGNVSVINEVLASILGKYKNEILGNNIDYILPELKNWKVEEIEKEILKLYGREVVVIKAPVTREDNIIGYMITMEDITEIQKLEHELRRIKRKSEHNAVYKFNDIICKSDLMQKNIMLAKRLALSDSTILIQGESGTGKEFFAQAIHNYSHRRMGPFVPVNFAALPVNLLESELFGYDEGAFTGAKKGGKPGLFEQAHGGTIFLDEIGDAPLEFQSRLLRVLQERRVRRVGGTKLTPVDVRVIAATNKNLKRQIELGDFRHDLFYRLNVLPLYIPGLRERKEDIPLLLRNYLKKFTNDKINDINNFFLQDTIEYLMKYEWPGNIRELVNVVEYLVNVKNSNCLITINDLPSYIIMDSNNMSESLSEYFLDENIIWLLRKIRDKEYAGRRTLARIAKEEGVELGEGKIRGLMKRMENLGFINVNKGAKGSLITEKGLRILSQ